MNKKHCSLKTTIIVCIIFSFFGCQGMIKNVAIGKKIDPIQLIKKHGFDTPRQLQALNSKISLSKHDESLYNQINTFSDYQNESLYNQINTLYLDIKDLKKDDFIVYAFDDFIVYAFDGRSNSNKRADIIKELLKLKNSIPLWLTDRVNALQTLKNEEDRIAISTNEAPQRVVNMFNKIEKPKNYNYIKNAFSLLPQWKVKVSFDPITDTASFLDNFNPLDFEDPNGLAQNTSRIFFNIPTFIDKNKEDYRLILGIIKNKFNNKYIISHSVEGSSYEALAEIDENVISSSGVNFSEQCVMICRLIGTKTARTIVGNKVVSIVKIKGIISLSNGAQFYKYVVGHPNEFPPQKYVKLTID